MLGGHADLLLELGDEVLVAPAHLAGDLLDRGPPAGAHQQVPRVAHLG